MDKSEPEPKHGEIRNHRMETVQGEDRELLDGRTGEVVYRGPMVSMTQTACEKWCSHCKKWVRCAGIMGPIRFLAFHDKADCVNDREAP